MALTLVQASAFAQLSPKAQQKFEKSIQRKLDGFLDTLKSNAEELAVADTTALPDINDNISNLDIDESDENYIFAKRLDSIQNEVPLTHNLYVQQYIDIYSNRKSFISNMLSWGKYYFPIFEDALKESEVPVELKYLPVIESAMNPTATSRVGAKGLWQFMHATAKAYGLNINNYVDERRDPELASKAAANYLKEAYEEFGDWLLAIASYNCGIGNVKRAIARSGGEHDFWAIRPYLPRETRNYVPAYIAATYMMSCYQQHQIEPSNIADDFKNAEQIYVSNPVNLTKLAQTLAVDANQLYLLNPAYTRHIVNANTEEPKAIILPAQVCVDRGLVFNALNQSTDDTPIHIQDTPNDRIYTRKAPTGKSFTVKVRKGQTLSTIAQNYGVSLGQIKSWNGLRSNKVFAGQNLRVHSSNTRYAKNISAKNSGRKYYSYKVKKGDTLSEIAEKRGVSVTTIKKLNGISSNHSIRPGMVLKVNRL